jgi:hypothetical protein
MKPSVVEPCRELRIRLSPGSPLGGVPADAVAWAEAVWSAACAANPNLFDGSALHRVATRRRKGTFEIEVQSVPYRFVYAALRSPERFDALTPLGVSGIVRSRSGGEDLFLLGERSHAVTQYPGFIELIPSGGMELEDAGAGGLVDHRARLLAELEEEASIPASAVEEIVDLGVVDDPASGMSDVICLVTLRSTLPNDLGSNREYARRFLASRRAVEDVVRSFDGRVVPTIWGCLELLDRHLNSERTPG